MDIYGFDAFSPAEIAEKVEKVGVVKARLAFLSAVMRGVLAGAFIGLGSLYVCIAIWMAWRAAVSLIRWSQSFSLFRPLSPPASSTASLICA